MLTSKQGLGRHNTAARRRELVEIARKMVATHGMANLTTRELAHAAGITEGAIYRHFRSKKEILLAMIDEIEETLFEALEKAKDGSPLEQLENVLRGHLSYVERRHGVSFLVVSEVLRNGDRQLRQRMQVVIERYLGMIEGILEQGAQAGQVKPNVDPTAAALLLFGLIQGSVTLWHFANAETPLGERHQALWQIYREAVIGS